MKRFLILFSVLILFFILCIPLTRADSSDKETLKQILNTQQEILKRLDALEKRLSTPQAQPSVDYNKIYEIPVGNSPVKGNKDASVTIVEFSDFQCPYCARLQPTLRNVLNAYPKDVRLVFKHYPLPFHPQARNAAKASMAAGEQGKFWEMHDMIFENFNQLTEEKFSEFAQKLGLDVKKFQADYNSNKYEQLIHEDMNKARDVNVTGTPTIFINGKRMMQRSFNDFKDAIDNILKTKKK